ncbi:type I-E CRISPR-associated protein Cse1/CasA [Streptomyces sp. NPDC087850]|uniref:type I-E CRISPR-associated protein Cse1/CasA n=1 Tax=Streptomyces sp. NPDC087850 TaxID=3365809 RepID=UPI0037FCBC90
MAVPSFPLTASPWIPVADFDTGVLRAVGITEALTRADRLQLAVPHSSAIPVLRLLAAVYDAACGPATTAEWDGAWRADTLDTARISAYTDRWADRLDLLHPTRPAFQCGALDQWNKGPEGLDPASLGGAAGEWFGGGPRDIPWEPADAAVQLLWLLAYDVAGIKRGAPGDPAARKNLVFGSRVGPVAEVTHLHLTGSSLKDSLLLSVPPQPRAPGDAPVWEQDEAPTATRTRGALGRLDRLTWSSRRIRLHATDDGTIDRLAVHAGDRLDGPPYETAERLDPMTLWRTTKTGKTYPRTITDDHWPTPWRIALALDPGTFGRSAAVQHATAAAERGTLDGAGRIGATAGEIVHSSDHKAVISSDVVITTLLGTGETLADPQTRYRLARRARYAEACTSDLRHAVREVAGDHASRFLSRLVFTDLDEVWLETVERDAADPDAARALWADAVAQSADRLIDRLPLRLDKRAMVQSAFRKRLANAAAKARQRPAGPGTSAEEDTPPRRRGGGRPATRYEWRGRQYSIPELVALPECHVSYQTLQKRLRDGMSVEEAVTAPGRRGPQPRAQSPAAETGTEPAQPTRTTRSTPSTVARYEWRGEQYTVNELAALPECHVAAKTVRRRLREGKSVEEAMAAPYALKPKEPRRSGR